VRTTLPKGQAMPSNQTTITPSAAISGLSYDRTIDRRRVHRASVSEVFLTDIETINPSLVLVAAQLPSSHSFFHDHEHDDLDPLLLLEVARQATIATAHELGAPTNNILISGEFELRLDLEAIRGLATSETNLVIENRFTWSSLRGGAPRAGRCDQRLLAGGSVIAEHWSTGRIMTRSQLEALRSEYRGTPPPLTHELEPASPINPLAPERVGRTIPENVVISDLTENTERVEAQITPHLSNRALFDHSYDHVTMQILTEASRQLHMVSASKGQRSEISAVLGLFHSFAELDSALRITSSKDGRFVIEQDDRLVASLTIRSSTNEQPKGQ
jgi:hypothetical protein